MCVICMLSGGRGGNPIIKTGSAAHDVFSGALRDDELYGLGGDDTLVGNAGADTLDGGRDNDDLSGDAGNDMVRGGHGDDIVRGGDGEDVVAGGAGDDVVRGGEGNDIARGGAGADVVRAGTGDDVVSGGAGNDRLFGGAGADRFKFGELRANAGRERDVVADFAEEDTIDLGGMASRTMTFLGEDAFSGSAGEVRVHYGNNDRAVVAVDVDGDARADLRIVLKDVVEVAADDFLL